MVFDVELTIDLLNDDDTRFTIFRGMIVYISPRLDRSDEFFVCQRYLIEFDNVTPVEQSMIVVKIVLTLPTLMGRGVAESE
jgi:hypothetical protein